MNKIRLCGTAQSAPVFSHENYGQRFFRFSLCVERLSGTCDSIPVLLPETLCAFVHDGAMLCIEGEVRSYNEREAVHHRLKIHVWALSICPWQGEWTNSVTLRGTLCRQPTYRRTPFGREIADMMLRVARAYHSPLPGRSDYLPCIAWGSAARFCAELPEGTAVELSGRLQSRPYIKVIDGVPGERTAYEISVSSVCLLGEEGET